MKRVYELKGQGVAIREIARRLEISRNTVRKYVRAPEVPKAKPRVKHGSKLDPYKHYILGQLALGVENCVVILRRLREQGYPGGYTILKEFVHPYRQVRAPQAVMRFETHPGDQAQVDFGKYRYLTPDGVGHWVWAFVMTLGWSRCMYVEFVPRADTSTFIRCHINGFTYLGGIARQCLYDNTKLVVLERDESGQPVWNERFLDFALRMGFDLRLCRCYRARTKGKVERGVGYVKRNFWPGTSFSDLIDLNRRVREWLATVANVRIHGTTRERPVDRLAAEQEHLHPLPEQERVQVFLREERKVSRDGYVAWDGARYGVHWSHAGCLVHVQASDSLVEIWSGDERLATHPRATRYGQKLTLPGQWEGLPMGDSTVKKAPHAFLVPCIQVERRSLEVYETAVVNGR